MGVCHANYGIYHVCDDQSEKKKKKLVKKFRKKIIKKHIKSIVTMSKVVHRVDAKVKKGSKKEEGLCEIFFKYTQQNRIFSAMFHT